jgi:hypothetical protein
MLAFMKTLASVILKFFRKPHRNFCSGFPSHLLVDFLKCKYDRRLSEQFSETEAAFEAPVIGGFLYAATSSL